MYNLNKIKISLYEHADVNNFICNFPSNKFKEQNLILD